MNTNTNNTNAVQTIATATPSKALTQAVKRIHTEESKANKSLFKIALELKNITENKLYISAGYDNIVTFADEVLDYSKAYTYRLNNVASRFLTTDDKGNPHTKWATETSDYTIGQLGEAVSLTDDQANQVFTDERVTPSISVRALRDIIKEVKQLSAPEEATEEAPEEATEEATTTPKPTADELLVTLRDTLTALCGYIPDDRKPDIIAQSAHILTAITSALK